jgi:hypothetical protein
MSATLDATVQALHEMSPDGLNAWFDKKFPEIMA